MNDKNVYIIVGVEFTKERIVADLIAEKYNHNFVFSKDMSSDQERLDHMKLCSEVWLFGTCVHTVDYGLAERLNKDFWRMG